MNARARFGVTSAGLTDHCSDACRARLAAYEGDDVGVAGHPAELGGEGVKAVGGHDLGVGHEDGELVAARAHADVVGAAVAAQQLVAGVVPGGVLDVLEPVASRVSTVTLLPASTRSCASTRASSKARRLPRPGEGSRRAVRACSAAVAVSSSRRLAVCSTTPAASASCPAPVRSNPTSHESDCTATCTTWARVPARSELSGW